MPQMNRKGRKTQTAQDTLVLTNLAGSGLSKKERHVTRNGSRKKKPKVQRLKRRRAA